MVPYDFTPELLPWMQKVQGDAYWYMATPYTKYPGGREEAFKEAARAAAWLFKHDVFVYAPIPHTYPVHTYGNIPDSIPNNEWSYEKVLRWDKAFAYSAPGIIVVQMTGWAESYGVTQERGWFREWNRPEVHLPWPQEVA